MGRMIKILVVIILSLGLVACGGEQNKQNKFTYKSTLQFDYSQTIKNRLEEIDGGKEFYQKVDVVLKQNDKMRLDEAICEVCKKEKSGRILLQLLQSIGGDFTKIYPAEAIDKNCKYLKEEFKDRMIGIGQKLQERYAKIRMDDTEPIPDIEYNHDLGQLTIYTDTILPPNKPEISFEIWEMYTSGEVMSLFQNIKEDKNYNPDLKQVYENLMDAQKIQYFTDDADYATIGKVKPVDTAEIAQLLNSPLLEIYFPEDVVFCWSKPQTLGEGEDNLIVYLYAVHKDKSSNLMINNADIKFAGIGSDPNGRGFNINIEMDENGARKFSDLTAKNIDKSLAICVGGVVHSAPRVMDRIANGRVEISFPDGEDIKEISKLAKILSSGTLPQFLKVIKTEKITQ